MEDEARWMKEEVPNFLDYIYEKGLKRVRPEAVRTIR
jgi:hypothetical protein